MFSDESYRAYLVGIADAETEAAIEKEILNGGVEPTHLRQIQEELIDDFVFGRLSPSQEDAFQKGYLSAGPGVEKLRFARALQRYAVERAPREAQQVPRIVGYHLFTSTWGLALAGAFGCLIMIALWLGERDLRLNRQLAQVTRSDQINKQTVAALLQDRGKPVNQGTTPMQPRSDEGSSSQAFLHRTVRLSPGVSRGVTAVPVVEISQHVDQISLELELPPSSQLGSVREELVDSNNRVIWSQNFLNGESFIKNHIAVLTFPTRLLQTSEYRLRVETGTETEGQTQSVLYLFRVYKDPK